MSRFASDATLDKILDYIAESTVLTLCHTQPTTYAQASVSYRLASVTVDSGDFSKANGDTSGRKLVVAAQLAVPVIAGGSVTHLALCKVSDSSLRFVTTNSDAISVEAGQELNISTFDIEIRDPAAP